MVVAFSSTIEQIIISEEELETPFTSEVEREESINQYYQQYAEYCAGRVESPPDDFTLTPKNSFCVWSLIMKLFGLGRMTPKTLRKLRDFKEQSSRDSASALGVAAEELHSALVDNLNIIFQYDIMAHVFFSEIDLAELLKCFNKIAFSHLLGDAATECVSLLTDDERTLRERESCHNQLVIRTPAEVLQCLMHGTFQDNRFAELKNVVDTLSAEGEAIIKLADSDGSLYKGDVDVLAGLLEYSDPRMHYSWTFERCFKVSSEALDCLIQRAMSLITSYAALAEELRVLVPQSGFSASFVSKYRALAFAKDYAHIELIQKSRMEIVIKQRISFYDGAIAHYKLQVEGPRVYHGSLVDADSVTVRALLMPATASRSYNSRPVRLLEFIQKACMNRDKFNHLFDMQPYSLYDYIRKNSQETLITTSGKKDEKDLDLCRKRLMLLHSVYVELSNFYAYFIFQE